MLIQAKMNDVEAVLHNDQIDGQSVDKTLKDLEDVYRNKIAFLRKRCKKAQLVFNLLSILSIILNLCGTIVGTSTKCKSMENRAGQVCSSKIALGILPGFGILLQTFLKLYEYEQKIYFRKLGVVQYKQIFNKIQAFRRGSNVKQEMLASFITVINILEDLVSDVCPLVVTNCG